MMSPSIQSENNNSRFYQTITVIIYYLLTAPRLKITMRASTLPKDIQ